MNLQSVLGTLLATGMGGRSRFGADGIGQVLSNTGYAGGGAFGAAPAAQLGGGGFKRMAGLGALGYLAYRALQERRRNSATGDQPAAAGRGGGLLGDLFGGIGGGQAGQAGPGQAGLGGSLGERLTRVLQGPADEPAADALPEVAMEDQQALLLLRAMITAANADGSISQEERQRILNATQEAGIAPDERRVLERELDNPLPLDGLLPEVRDEELAEQVYLASRAAIDQDSETGRAYLAYLASRLQIPAGRLSQIQAA